MSWFDKLERQFGFIAIPHLILGIIGLQAVMTLIGIQNPDIQLMLALNPAAVVDGQWWRLFTYILVPDVSRWGAFFAIFWFYFLWMMGKALESHWGGFRLTLYVLSGIFFGAFVSMAGFLFLHLNIWQDGTYWTLSMQLAFAYLYPEFQILVFFILPLKMRWLAWGIVAFLAYKMVLGGLPRAFEILGSLANFLIFFAPEILGHWRNLNATRKARSTMKASTALALSKMPPKVCVACRKGVDQADIRLCHCDRCGHEGRFWCTDDLRGHLGT